MGTVSEPDLEFRDIRCSHSENLPELLTRLRLSVLISTYQTGHLVVVAARQGRLVLTFHQFERAMGIAVKPGTIAVCTRKEVWFVRDAPDIAAKLEPRGHYDACFLARTAHFTDDRRGRRHLQQSQLRRHQAIQGRPGPRQKVRALARSSRRHAITPGRLAERRVRLQPGLAALRNTTAVATGRAEFASLDDVPVADFKQALEGSAQYISRFLDVVAGRLGLDHDRVLMGKYAFPGDLPAPPPRRRSLPPLGRQ